jgi:hypothetical protein
MFGLTSGTAFRRPKNFGRSIRGRLPLKILAGKMTTEELAEADRLVAEWQPDPAVCELQEAQARNSNYFR